MKCLACGKELETTVGQCPRCQFPVISAVETNSQVRAQIQIQADTYIEKKLEAIQIGIIVYQYEMDENNELKLKNSKELKLADAIELADDSIHWLEQNFTRIETQEEVNLNVYVKERNAAKKEYHCKVLAPAVRGFTHLGVKKAGKTLVQVVWGDETTYVVSEVIDLLS